MNEPMDLRAQLTAIGPAYLKPSYREKWTSENPTFGYCYLISEILYHFVYPKSKSYCLNLGPLGTHWFLKNDGVIIDWTKDQFDFAIPYEKARGCGFFKGSTRTERGYISKNAHQLGMVLGLIENERGIKGK
jgi:hypothetical protein